LGFDIEKEIVVKQKINNINPPALKDCVKIKTNNRELLCSTDHPILVRNKRTYRSSEIYGTRKDICKKTGKVYITPRHKQTVEYTNIWKNAGDVMVGDFIIVANGIDVWGTSTLFDARLVGMLIGDGSYGFRRHYDKIEYKTPSFSNCDEELVNYVLNNYSCNVELQKPTKDGRLYHEISIRGLVQKLKDIGIAGQSKDKKRLPTEYMNLTKEDSALLLAGLFDTDGSVYSNKNKKKSPNSITITQSSEEMLIQIKELLEKFGITSTINKALPKIIPGRKDKNPWYILTISSKKSIVNFAKNIPLLIKYKQDKLKEILLFSEINNVRKYNLPNNFIEERIVEVENIGKKPIYNLTADEHHTYLANNIITHNTGGETGEAFEGATEMVYNPEGYRILGVPNIYDKGLKGNTTSALFVSEVLNLEGYYDKDGNSDVIGALAFIMRDRFNVKYNTSKPEGISGHIAEHPISLAESIMRKEGSIFPTAEIKEYLDHCRAQGPAFFKSSYVGELVADSNGNIKWCTNNDLLPLRSFRLGQHDHKEGCLEIFEMPKKDSVGVVSNRYIVYVDPIDSDSGTSLGSVGVFDTFYQWVVAEYTGRPKFANEFYEIVRKLAIFYNGVINYENNLKGLYTYFDQKHCTYLLCDNPSVLVDKEMMKRGYGNTLKGTRATPEINAYGRRLIRDWLITDAKPYFQEFDLEGSQITHYLNLHTIKSLPLLEELLAWDGVINTDRVSAMIMCMILNEEYKKYNQVFTEKSIEKDFAASDYWDQYSTSGGFSYGPRR
jgi:intein/homing endonuclease